MNTFQLLGAVVLFASVFLWLTAFKKVRAGKFFAETPALYFFGSYVWGDALVISIFWLGIALLSVMQLLPAVALAILIALFYLFRSAFEVVYWLNHQSTNSSFSPPLTRGIDLTPEQGAILYQLGHFLIVVVSAATIWLLTFGK